MGAVLVEISHSPQDIKGVFLGSPITNHSIKWRLQC
jgi:hypothetical protein